jgi:hypothetical protein
MPGIAEFLGVAVHTAITWRRSLQATQGTVGVAAAADPVTEVEDGEPE